jgi:hypothetical protein
MAQIVDVSPTSAKASTSGISNSVTGRMLSIASPDGESVYVGSYSNIWASSDGGQNFAQLSWPQPESGQFEVPGAIGGWGVVDIAAALGWRVDEHPRLLARLTASGHDDIVGFGDCGVWTALGNGDGSFQRPRVVINNFGYNAGAWRVGTHPRFVLDIDGDGLADIVGFGEAGVWTAIGNGDGTFKEPQLVLENFGTQQGWQADNPRFLAVLTKSGFPDIVGFGTAGVWTALGDGHGSFKMTSTTIPVLDNFGTQQGWQADQNPRFVLDLNGDGFADIVGFGNAGVWTAIGDGQGAFKMTSTTAPVLDNFGTQQGWQVNTPRLLAVLTKGGFPDIVGFGNAGVWTALGDGRGSFKMTSVTLPVLDNFGVQQGWQVDENPRFLAVTTASGLADIVGFGNAGVWTATSKGGGAFNDAVYVLPNFGVQQGWQVARHPRLLARLTGKQTVDIVAFGDAGVWTALGDGNAGFPNSNFVLASFAYGSTVLAITVNDLATNSRGIWRSSDGGSTWTLVHQFATNNPSVGQLQWALGSDHLVYAAGGSSIAISQDGGMTFTDVVPWAPDPPNSGQVNHIAVWQNAPADLAPQVIYALGPSTMWLSFDGGAHWIKDRTPTGPLPQFPGSVGAPATISVESNTSTVMVISPRNQLEVFVAQDGSGPGVAAALYSGDYSQFPFGTMQSKWVQLPLPSNLQDPNTQDSGNVFLLTTQKGRGDLLFYGAQHYHEPGDWQSAQASVGPLSPASGSDWHQLGLVHVDLHGFLLSPNFAATIEPGGNYKPGTGTAWILSDGGIYRSTDGGNTFNRSAGATTLACLSVAGVSNAGSGPALCVNEGDNDGFYSGDDGKNWSYLDYQGGDNDCAFADPLRSFSMLVQTPRWGHTVTVYETSPGNLPNAGNGTGQRHTVPGPAAGNDWNAAGYFGNRGTKPIVHSVVGVPPPPQGDYIFVLNPKSPQPQVVRTQNIRDITSSSEWVTTATGPGQGKNVYRYGPPLPAFSSAFITNPSMGIVQASGGHINTIVYAGGDGTLWTWGPGAENWTNIVPRMAGTTAGATSAIRFFVSPYQTNVVYILDIDHVRRSDDFGVTWNVDPSLEQQLTWNGQIPISITDSSSGLQTDNGGGVGDYYDVLISDMKFDPNNPLIRFAVGRGGAFYTNDGVNWIQVLHTGALSGRPTSCYYDFITNPDDPALYVAFAGRSVVKISQLPKSTVP